MDKIKIYKPNPRWGHSGDTFRQIIDMWAESEYVEVHESPDRYVWWNAPGDVLLHDVPMILDVVDDLPDHKHGLFGNEQHEDGSPWIFWGRHPRMLEQMFTAHARVPIKYRMWKSIFIGKIENDLQTKNRFQTRIDWSKHIQNFMVVKGFTTPYPYSPADYLYNMSCSKFALLLPGYGPKCNRDIEACGCGSIPIVTPGVDTTYYDKWVEGENYLRMEKEEDLEEIFNTPNDVLDQIQQNNYEWYERNCSTRWSFETTKRIIHELQQ